MSKLQVASIITYSLVTFYFGISWLMFSRRTVDSASPVETFLSFIIFIITTFLWPFAILISFLQILKTQKFELNTLITLVISLCIFGISFYLA
jgi:cation transport ATPase